jgi:hypothetical protein
MTSFSSGRGAGDSSSCKDGSSGDDDRALAAEDRKSILRLTGSGVDGSVPTRLDGGRLGDMVLDGEPGERFFLGEGRSRLLSLLKGVRGNFSLSLTAGEPGRTGPLWSFRSGECVCFRGMIGTGGEEGGDARILEDRSTYSRVSVGTGLLSLLNLHNGLVIEGLFCVEGDDRAKVQGFVFGFGFSIGALLLVFELIAAFSFGGALSMPLRTEDLLTLVLLLDEDVFGAEAGLKDVK